MIHSRTFPIVRLVWWLQQEGLWAVSKAGQPRLVQDHQGAQFITFHP